MHNKAAVIETPKYYMQEQTAEISIDSLDKGDSVVLLFNGENIAFQRKGNSISISKAFHKSGNLKIIINEEEAIIKINPIPLWLSIIPPLIAILLALVFREVISSLLIGLFSGALIINIYSNGFLLGCLKAFMTTIDTYILGSINDSGHISILLFSLMIGAMVSVISKNGGMQGVVNRISKHAISAKSGQFATWLLGVVIFFDDYANTLIVGNTMRPVTDRLHISREKLAYLVDSTAAPVAAIAFITTWIGAELGYIGSGIENIEGLNEGVYATFMNSLSYSFYPILTLLFMLIIIFKGRDFGPMYHAEKKARLAGEIQEENEKTASILDDLAPKKGIQAKAFNAILPVLFVVLGTFAGLIYTGYDSLLWTNENISFGIKISTTIGAADSYLALLWASLAGLIVAIKLSLFGKKLSLTESIEASMSGFKTMIPALGILVLAWALALVIEDLHTATFITSLMSDNVNPYFIPTLTFILASLIAFSTGSSWGTMAILYPLILPAAWKIAQDSGLDYNQSLAIFHNAVSCVLAGAVLGDHCSPISDTTILSSLSSSCNHIEHVRTQMPYALTVGIVSICFGTIPAAFGAPMWLSLLISIIVLYLIVHFFGKKTEVLALDY